MRSTISAALLLLSITAVAQVQPPDTRGREFWMGFMQNASGTQQLSVKIAAAQATTGTLSVPLAGWSTSFSVAANGVTSVAVPSIYETTGSETAQPKGLYLTSVEPVTVTLVNYQNQTTDAAQLLPLKSLGTSYRVDALPGTSTAYQNGQYIFRSEFMVVATQDGTEVSITPTATTTAGHAPGVPFTVQLNAGQTYQVQALSGLTDLTGTTVKGTAQNGSCRPFAVFGGSMCAVVSCAACDHVNEQMIPVDTWGNAFHTVPLDNLSTWGFRVLANENGTLVTINGGAPVPLNAGGSYTVPGTNQPACITSDKPVSVAQYMVGATCAGSGDPSLLLLTADDRMSTSAAFTTLFSTQGAMTHWVSVVTATGSIAQLQLDGNPIPAASFTTYAACPGLSCAKVQVTAGQHRLTSPAGFLAYAYGLASGESYLYSLSNTMAPPPPPSGIICSTDPVTLTSPVVLSNAQWTMASDPGTVLATGNSYTFTPDHNDTYRVDGVLLPSGCAQHFEFQVGLPVQPHLNLTANNAPSTTVCQFNSVQLGTGAIANANWFDLNWSPSAQVSDPTIPNPVAYPAQDTWYKLLVTSPVGCGSALDSVFVHVQPSTIYALRTTVSDDSICAGNSAQLHAEVERVLFADAFEGAPAAWWESIQGGTASAACGSVTGTALYFNGGGTRSATTPPINFSNGGVAHFALKIATGAAPCEDADPGDDVVLEYSTNGSTWQLLATFNEAAFPAFTQLDVPVPALGSAATAMRLRWRQLAHGGAGHDNWSMDNLLITRYEDASGQLAWSPAAGLSSPTAATPTASPTASTWYKATVANGSGCLYTDSVLVHVAPAFSILPINDTTRCGTAGTQLLAQSSWAAGVTWAWAPATGLSSAAVANPVASPAATTTYTVNASNTWGCTASRQVTVAVSKLAAVAATASSNNLCHGQSVNLSAAITSTGTYTLAWSPNGSVASPAAANTAATPSATTTYVCTATDTPTGCTQSSAVTVNVAPAYVLHTTADTTVCTALGLQLHASHNMAQPYQAAWTPAANLNAANILQPSILANNSATYVLTLTDANGCTATDSTHITVAFENLVTPVNLSTCAGQQLVLDAGYPGSTYSWNTNASSQTISVGQPGQYTVTITEVQACQVIKSFFATFNPLPVVDLGSDQALCGVPQYTLNAGNPGSSKQWSTGATTDQITVAATGTYSVTVTDNHGCQATDAAHIALNPLPANMLQDVTACETNPVTLNAGNPGSSYAWSTGDTGPSITPATSGTYTVAVTTPQNCSATFSAAVVLMPRVAVSLGPDLALCAGDPLVLGGAASPGVSYLWGTGQTTPSIQVSASGTYTLAATNGYCSGADTVAVLFHPLPANNLADQTACTGLAITFDAANAGSTFAWSTGSSAQSISITAPGPYSVQVTNAFGCHADFSATAAFVPPPSVHLGPDTVLCAGQLLTLDAGNPGATYSWSNGSTARTIAPTASGAYTVSVNNGYCSTSGTITVHFNPVPEPMPSHQYYTCLDEDPHYIAVDAGNPGCTYRWDGGQQAQVINARTYGWHGVSITNVFGCTRKDSAQVVEFCRPTIFIPNTFTPNGDGRNDVWLPVGNNIAEYDMYVFDRWGGVLFHSMDVNTGWNGTANGNPVPNDVYVYQVTFRLQEDSSGHLGFEQTRTGHVQVLR